MNFHLFCSVPRCPRDDLRWFRVPDDVPEQVWIFCSGFEPVAVSLSSTMGYDCTSLHQNDGRGSLYSKLGRVS